MNTTPVNSVFVVGALLLVLTPVAPRASAEDEQQPSLELLEFLGEWETEDGVWIDPLSLLETEESDLESGEDDEKDE